MNKRANRTRQAPKPLMRIRHLLAGVCIVAVCTAGPLLVVQKQVYIRSASIRREALADSLDQRSRELARLKLAVERLSSNERIESVARSALGLDYPSYGQITILDVPRGKRAGALEGWEFFAILKRSFAAAKG